MAEALTRPGAGPAVRSSTATLPTTSGGGRCASWPVARRHGRSRRCLGQS